MHSNTDLSPQNSGSWDRRTDEANLGLHNENTASMEYTEDPVSKQAKVIN